ncbi:ATP-dependent DNA helicase PIF1-like [Macrobrachium nipponense]|uniref:ATP-dependent DNA helicase PIF1-like n=1 Tax=Macrobrachium nipponense TaxID=159736 RepID=UPI0030C7FE62
MSRIIAEEIDYDTDSLRRSSVEVHDTLNIEQRHVYDMVVNAVFIGNSEHKIFALSVSSGTGKTYLINAIIDFLRSEKKVVLATALSGIAATLLHNGTLHSRFKIPFNITPESTCQVSDQHASAQLFRMKDLIIIDEVSQGDKLLFECLDRSLRNIRKNQELFGGICVLFVGDWKQILPVVKHGSRAQIVNATLKTSYIWKSVTELKLSLNMRVRNPSDATFASYLRDIGSGNCSYIEPPRNMIEVLPEFVLESSSISDTCKFVFDGLSESYADPSWLCSQAVIASTNEVVNSVNEHMINNFPGESREYFSSDTIEDENYHQYPQDF